MFDTQSPLPTIQDMLVGATASIMDTNNEEKLTCYGDGNGGKKCFMRGAKNALTCKEDQCFISFSTVNQNIMGKGKEAKKLGLDMLLFPNGLSTTITLVGNLKRENLPDIEQIIGTKLKVIENDAVPMLINGTPDPPSKCHLNPLSKACSPFLKSDHFSWIPGIGMKKVDELVKDPKSFFKTEIKIRLPEIKKALQDMFKKKENTSSIK